MLDFQQKRKLRSFAYNRITLVVLAVLVILSVRSVWSVYQKQRESEQLKTLAADQLNTLTTQQNELQANINRLQTAEGVEAEIRSKFNVVKNKENMVIIMDDTASATVATTTPKSLWQKFLGLF